MNEILLVNPHPRRSKRARSKIRRRRSKARRRSRRKTPKTPGFALPNPGRRRRRRASYHLRRARRRTNPSPRLSVRSIQGNVINAVPGAFGALGLDILLGLVPIPAEWKAGMVGYLTKALGAIGLGMVANMAVSAKTATAMTEGALTVMLHGAMRELVATNLPQVPLGMYLPSMNGMGYYGSGWNPAFSLDAQNVNAPLSAYLPDLSQEHIPGYDSAPMSATDEDFY